LKKLCVAEQNELAAHAVIARSHFRFPRLQRPMMDVCCEGVVKGKSYNRVQK
jgi:hypothetical protein